MKVLLVDDDRFVLNVLEQTIAWDKLGFTDVLQAANMHQAQALLKSTPIDLVISDIEMPQGSGLDLLEWLRHELKSSAELIFLTNYADFNYAQKAIELGSFDYYLKPVIPDTFTTVLSKAIAKIQVKKQTAARHAHPALTAAAWHRLLNGQESAETAAQLEDSDLLPVIVQPERGSKVSALHLRLSDGQETFGTPAFTPAFTFPDNNHRLVLLLKTPKTSTTATSSITSLVPLGQALREALSDEHTNFTLFIGTLTPAKQLAAVYQQLTLMVAELAVHRNSIHFLSFYHHQQIDYLEPDLQLISQLIAKKAGKELHDYCQQYLQTCLTEQRLNRRTLRNFREDLLQQIYVELQRHNVQAHKLFSSREYQSLYLDSLNNLEIMFDFIDYVTASAFSYAEFADSSISVAQRLQKYIDSHLGDDLTRESLAEIVYLNPDYAAKLFKDEFGLSINHYIINRRIAVAQHLIVTDNRPINQIAESLGYTNFSYFTRLFKREVGQTPMAYRHQQRALQSPV